MTIQFERQWAMPHKNTFTILPIRKLLGEELTSGIWLDPFANNNTIKQIFGTLLDDIKLITNDLNPEYLTDYHLDAYEFLQMFSDSSIDGVLYDPPYSPRQVSEYYRNIGIKVNQEMTRADVQAKIKNQIARIIKKNGKVLSFGWSSGGIGTKLGFIITRILLVPHGAGHNDTIVTVERKGMQLENGPDEISQDQGLFDYY